MSRLRIALAVVGGCAVSLVVGAAFVRVMLDRSDAQPYAGAATERGYVVVAVAALVIWWGGSALSLVLGRRAWRARRHEP